MCRPLSFALLLTGVSANLTPAPAQSVRPEALPDPQIPGYRFPESEATLTRWTTEMTRGTSADQRDAAAAKIYLHGWGLWAALVQETRQYSGGQPLRVFETWSTVDDLLNSARLPTAAASARPLPESTERDIPDDVSNRLTPRRSGLQPLPQLERDDRDVSATTADHTAPVDRAVGLVKYSPTAAAHIVRQELLHLSTLDILVQAGAQQIPPFPSDALVLKPIYQIARTRDRIAGRYFALKAWSGPPSSPRPYGPAEWPGAVWIDCLGGGVGNGAIDFSPAVDGSSRTAASTYPLATLLYYPLTDADAAALNLSKPGIEAAAGDLALLVGLHASTRETARWTWQTYWWTPAPGQSPAPSSAAIAAARPRGLQGAAAHYAMAVSYSMVSPDQPYVGGSPQVPAVYAYNPWLEAKLGAAELPDSRRGLDPSGQPAANDVGIQTNCMSCHAQANYNPRRYAHAPRPTGARYVDLGAAEFTGALQVDFLWSLPRHAR